MRQIHALFAIGSSVTFRNFSAGEGLDYLINIVTGNFNIGGAREFCFNYFSGPENIANKVNA